MKKNHMIISTDIGKTWQNPTSISDKNSETENREELPQLDTEYLQKSYIQHHP